MRQPLSTRLLSYISDQLIEESKITNSKSGDLFAYYENIYNALTEKIGDANAKVRELSENTYLLPTVELHPGWTLPML